MNFGQLSDDEIEELAGVLVDTDDDVYMGLDQLGINSRSELIDIGNIKRRLRSWVIQDYVTGYWEAVNGDSE